jgi:hypothetical protein
LWTFRPAGVEVIPQPGPRNPSYAVIPSPVFVAYYFTAYSSEHDKTINMESSLYIVAVILLIAWLVGFLGYAAGGLVHVLLVLAVIAVLLNITGGNRRRI